MIRPTVSIIVPAYNCEGLLPRALDSIVGQTFGDWEIVLVDDGSTDRTDGVADAYALRLPGRFQHLRQPHAGSSAARNRGIDASRGRFVAFLDADDEFLPTKLERQLALFELQPELGLVYSDYAYVDLAGAAHESVFDTKCPSARSVPHEVIGPHLCVCTGDFFDLLIREYFISTIVGMVRRENLGAAVRFPVGQSYAEEWMFYLRVARVCRVGFVDEPLCLHHHVRGSLSRTDSHRNTLRMYDLLTRMRTSFDGLTRRQRQAIRGNILSTCRQLAYDAGRAHRVDEEVHRFAEAFRLVPGWRSGCELFASVFRRMFPTPADARGLVTMNQDAGRGVQ